MVCAMHTLKQKVIHGLLWRSMERFGSQAVSFLVSIVLARLLAPEEFGVFAILAIFLAVAGVFVDSGFGSALIQKKDADDLDFNSIFYLNIGASLLVYLLLFSVAPLIASFYGKPILAPVLRWSALMLVFNGINGIQNAVLAREMKFDLSFYVNLSGIVSSGVVGVAMAYAGYGVWALVVSQLGGAFVSTVARWFLIGWRPALQFSVERVRALFLFGSRIMATGLIDVFFNQVYGLIIGKWYSPADLAYYNRGDSIPCLAMGSVQGVVGGVVFPLFSKIQDDKAQMKAVMRRMMRMSSFFVFPALFGLAAVAKPLVELIFTEKWLPCVPFLQVACLYYAFWPLHVANLQIVQACGRSDILLRIELIKKVLLVALIAATFKYGVLALAIGRCVHGVISIVINVLPSRKLIDYSLREQLGDLLPSFLLAVGVGAGVSLVELTALSAFPLLLLQGFTFVLVFLGVALALRMEPLQYVIANLKRGRT